MINGSGSGGVEELVDRKEENRRRVMAGIEGPFIPPRQCMLAASTLGQPVSLPQLQREGREVVEVVPCLSGPKNRTL
jgi:hypothetical protein